MAIFTPAITNETLTSRGGVNTVAVTPTSLTVVKASAGRLCSVLLSTVNGANQINIFDNATAASGIIIGVIAAAAPAGTVATFDMPALNGITIAATAASSVLTVSFI